MRMVKDKWVKLEEYGDKKEIFNPEELICKFNSKDHYDELMECSITDKDGNIYSQIVDANMLFFPLRSTRMTILQTEAENGTLKINMGFADPEKVVCIFEKTERWNELKCISKDHYDLGDR